jgi:uncharacterized membrane protein YkvA (DUF1232 family)
MEPSQSPVPTPAAPGCWASAWPWLCILLGGAYLLNPGMGVLEFIPDALPMVGNLDEAGATALLIQGVIALRKARSAR